MTVSLLQHAAARTLTAILLPGFAARPVLAQSDTASLADLAVDASGARCPAPW